MILGMISLNLPTASVKLVSVNSGFETASGIVLRISSLILSSFIPFSSSARAYFAASFKYWTRTLCNDAILGFVVQIPLDEQLSY